MLPLTSLQNLGKTLRSKRQVSRDDLLGEADNWQSVGLDIDVRHKELQQHADSHLKTEAASLRETPEERKEVLRIGAAFVCQFDEVRGLTE